MLLELNRIILSSIVVAAVYTETSDPFKIRLFRHASDSLYGALAIPSSAQLLSCFPDQIVIEIFRECECGFWWNVCPGFGNNISQAISVDMLLYSLFLAEGILGSALSSFISPPPPLDKKSPPIFPHFLQPLVAVSLGWSAVVDMGDYLTSNRHELSLLTLGCRWRRASSCTSPFPPVCL